MRSGLARSALALLLVCVGVVVVIPVFILLRASWVEGRGQLAEVITEPDFRSAVALYPGCRRLSNAAWSARVPP